MLSNDQFKILIPALAYIVSLMCFVSGRIVLISHQGWVIPRWHRLSEPLSASRSRSWPARTYYGGSIPSPATAHQGRSSSLCTKAENCGTRILSTVLKVLSRNQVSLWPKNSIFLSAAMYPQIVLILFHSHSPLQFHHVLLLHLPGDVRLSYTGGRTRQ